MRTNTNQRYHSVQDSLDKQNAQPSSCRNAPAACALSIVRVARLIQLPSHKPRAAVWAVFTPSSDSGLGINPVRQMMASATASTQKAAADRLIWATWSHSPTPPPVDGKITQPLLLLVMGCRRPEVLRALGGRKSVCRRPARPRPPRPPLAQKAAARGRSALDMLRVASRGLCLARPLQSDASHTSEMR
jgi:hypothetical protein